MSILGCIIFTWVIMSILEGVNRPQVIEEAKLKQLKSDRDEMNKDPQLANLLALYSTLTKAEDKCEVMPYIIKRRKELEQERDYL